MHPDVADHEEKLNVVSEECIDENDSDFDQIRDLNDMTESVIYEQVFCSKVFEKKYAKVVLLLRMQEILMVFLLLIVNLQLYYKITHSSVHSSSPRFLFIEQILISSSYA